MTTTDTDALTERIARAYYENRVAAIESEQERQSWPAWEDHEKADADEWRDAAASALPIIAEEVRKAKAEAWDDGEASGLTEAAGGHGWPNPYRETGDSDEHR
ncbi:hypothetical protein [Brachybacterium paraconglomeratum]|uniref:hypothetical protein n=1 Tax=Brachybacterium paraconglomeratum TaxID=173362 RepID=UPI0022E424B9|nr:hypothetical protein [Brachybacterium paraconglomeratum]